MVEAVKKLFPETGWSKKWRALNELYEEYYGSGGLVPSLSAWIGCMESELSTLEEDY